MDAPAKNLLVVSCLRYFPLRNESADTLYSFRHYSGHRCFYVNALWGFPLWLRWMKFDAVIFTSSYVCQRWDRETFGKRIEQAQFLQDAAPIRAVMPQDEFLNTDLLCEFINRVDATHVFSVAPESEWPMIYEGIDRTKVKLYKILTGYLEARRVALINQLAAQSPARRRDIGYRAWHAEPWLGRHGQLKIQVGTIFKEAGEKRGMNCDISTKSAFQGNDWLKFLLDCRYTVGVEGGASICDRDGSLRAKTGQYLKMHPAASFEEVEAACFPGLDGTFQLKAISPRHLEACATRTCQVLIEGEYSGVLIKDVHYISVKPDFSNLQEVLDQMQDESAREAMVERAYQDVVASGRWSYPTMVEFILDKIELANQPKTRSLSLLTLVVLVLGRIYEWGQTTWLSSLGNAKQLAKRILRRKK